MFQYDPKMADNLWPVDVEYDAQLMQAVDSVSKKSNQPMTELKIKVFNDDGRTQIISDYITSASLFKLKQLARAIDREDEFNNGTFDPRDHEGDGFKVLLSIESSDEFGDKNKIKKYKAGAPETPAPTTPPQQYPRNRQTVLAGHQRGKQPLPPTNGPEFAEDDVPF